MGIHRKDAGVGGVRVTTLTLDNPKANVIDLDHCRELTAAFVELTKENRSRVVVLRGAGRFFSTGVDIKQHTPEIMPTLLPAFHEIFYAMWDLPAITVAAVHGYCLGGAAELAFAADRVIAQSQTKIGFPEIKVGCYPPVAIAMMTQRIGQGRATEMILSGDETPASTLHEWGVVDAITDDAELDGAIARELERYSDKSPAVLGMGAKLLHDEVRRTWGSRIEALEKAYLQELLPHPDATEGILAFGEKRKPNWKDAEA